MIKILHTGDMHLDSAFGGLDFAQSEAARDDQRRVFATAMRYAKERNFDMVLICGDLFDGRYVTQATLELVNESLSALSCPVVIAPGNHDPYSMMSIYRSGKLPDNVFVFSSEEMQVFDFDALGISVCGYAFNSDRVERSPLCDFTPPETTNKLLLCAHADITSPTSKYAPISLYDIERCGFVYAALGHIHNAPEDIKAPSGAPVRYCGALMSRGFDEEGTGGALVVTIGDEEVCVEKVSFTDRQHLVRSLDVSGAENEREIEERIMAAIHKWGYESETSLCIELCGTVPLDCVIREERLSGIKIPLARLKIKDKTVAVPDADFLELDLSLRGELYRTLLPSLKGADAEQRRVALEAFRLAMCAIDGKNLADMLAEE